MDDPVKAASRLSRHPTSSGSPLAPLRVGWRGKRRDASRHTWQQQHVATRISKAAEAFKPVVKSQLDMFSLEPHTDRRSHNYSNRVCWHKTEFNTKLHPVKSLETMTYFSLKVYEDCDDVLNQAGNILVYHKVCLQCLVRKKYINHSALQVNVLIQTRVNTQQGFVLEMFSKINK